MTTHQVSDRYRLVREIGRGGMGAVYLGEDDLLHRPVALKRIGFAPEGPQEGVDAVRAEREARLAAMVNHPHVVAVYDLVESDDQQWLVMELVEGTPLSELLETEGPLASERAAALVAQAADALHAAHEAHVVHRDVKPSNMLVTTDDQVKLTDFGIARGETDASLTRTGMVTGSPAYLAPEVASGQSATTASDVWSLGATLYHALTGHTPYAVGDNVLGTLFRIVNDEPPRLSPTDPLAPLLEHTMATDPADRWTMAEVRDDLQRAALGARRTGAATQSTQLLTPPPPAEPSFLEAATAREDDGDGDHHGPPPAGSSTGGHAASRKPSRTLPAVVVALAVVLVAILGLWLGMQGTDDDGDVASPGAPTSSADGGRSPSPSDSGRDSGSPSPSPSPSPSDEPDAADMRGFVEGYVATAASDPGAGFPQLTPGFQDASGGLSGYSGFWSTVESATVRDVRADPESLTVSYTVDYVFDGGEEKTEEVGLTLELQDGRYLVAGES